MSRSGRFFIISFILLLTGVCSLSAQSGIDPIDVSHIDSLSFDLNSNLNCWPPEQIPPGVTKSITSNRLKFRNIQEYLPEIGGGIPQFDQAGINKSKSIQQSVPGTTSLPGLTISEFKDFKSAEAGQLRSIYDQLDGVGFKNLNADSIDLDQLAEQHLTRLEPIQKLQQEQLMGMQQVQLKGNEINQFNDQDLVQQATDYFKGHESELRDAQDLMSKLKKKYRSVPNSNDLSTAIMVFGHSCSVNPSLRRSGQDNSSFPGCRGPGNIRAVPRERTHRYSKH